MYANETRFKHIEELVNTYKEKNGTSPTIREIAAEVGYTKSTVAKFLSYMRAQTMPMG